jgi:hypothetical protein
VRRRHQEIKIELGDAGLGLTANDYLDAGIPRNLRDFEPSASDPHSAEMADALVKYEMFSLEHRRRVFEQQYYCGWMIFVTVIALVAAGIGFSGWQLSFSMRRPGPKTSHTAGTRKFSASERSQAEASAEAQIDLNSTFKASKEGFEVSSSVVGVIILALSFAFFFAYLKYVYPISFVGGPTPVSGPALETNGTQ